MILPTPPTSPRDSEDQTLPPPSYRESVPSSQLLPRERPTLPLYAPPVSSRSGSSYEREEESTPRLHSQDGGKPGILFAEPVTSEPPPPPPKGETELSRDGPTQRAFGVFSSMIWGAPSNASTSRSTNIAGSSSNAFTTQDPLNPAPPAFTRPTPKNYAYLPFGPMTMLGISSNLADGFPTIPPPINPEDEKQVGKANAQHPFVSHDVTEDDWSKFLTGLKTVASRPNQAPKSFLARMFLGEMNERDQRKSAIHFVDSWNHYFFQPRSMTVVLARGRKIFSGASGIHPRRRHSVGGERGRSTDPTHAKGHRHRSRSTDSSSSSASSLTSSSDSSVHSTTSEPHDGARTGNDYGFGKGIGGQMPGMGMGRSCGWGGRGHGGPSHTGKHGGHGGHCGRGGRGGRGWCPPGVPGPSDVPPIPGLGGGPLRHGEPWQPHTRHQQKRAWEAEKRAWKAGKRAMRHEHRQMKRAMRHEKRQRRREAKAMRYHGGKSCHKGDQPWKLIISFHGAHRESGQL